MALPERSVALLAILVTLSCGFTSALYNDCKEKLVWTEDHNVIFGWCSSRIWFYRVMADARPWLAASEILHMMGMEKGTCWSGFFEGDVADGHVFQFLEIPCDRFLIVYARNEGKDYEYFMAIYKFDATKLGGPDAKLEDRWMSANVTLLENSVPLHVDDPHSMESKLKRYSYYVPDAKALVLGSECYKIDESGGTTFTATKIDCAKHKLDNSCGVNRRGNCMYEPCTNSRTELKADRLETTVVALNDWFIYRTSSSFYLTEKGTDEKCEFLYYTSEEGGRYKKVFGIKHSYKCKNGKKFDASSSIASVTSLSASLIIIAFYLL